MRCLLSARPIIVVELLELALDDLELLLRDLDLLLEVLEAGVHVVDIVRARLVFLRAEVLDLFAGVLDLCQTQRRAAAFEEVAQGGELFEVARFAVLTMLEEGTGQGGDREG